MSGGVDSSVTAALLKEAGAHVHGVFIKGWYPPNIPCSWREDRQDAMRVAAHLGIAFTTLDAGKEYKQHVSDYLTSEYRAGRTPNPDIMCNRYVKFGTFYNFAVAHGVDFIATGHYARVQDDMILRGVDPDKDQSYFLFDIEPRVLSRVLFPLGEYTKKQVREMARKYDLPTALKKDSQGICFLGHISIEDFLAAELPLEEGVIETEQGERIGTHGGSLAYTLGERVSVAGAEHPWYVLRKDIDANTLIVSETPASTQCSTIKLSHVNLFREVAYDKRLEAQYRYHGRRIGGSFDASKSEFILSEPLSESLAPGQALVLYKDETLIGGGIIEQCR